jgi:hypothetical protein
MFSLISFTKHRKDFLEKKTLDRTLYLGKIRKSVHLQQFNFAYVRIRILTVQKTSR